MSHILDKLFTNINSAVNGEFLLNKHQLLGALADAGSYSLNPCNSHGAGRGACWIPVDIFMENAMDGKHLYAISAVEILTGSSCLFCFILSPFFVLLLFQICISVLL